MVFAKQRHLLLNGQTHPFLKIDGLYPASTNDTNARKQRELTYSLY